MGIIEDVVMLEFVQNKETGQWCVRINNHRVAGDAMSGGIVHRVFIDREEVRKAIEKD